MNKHLEKSIRNGHYEKEDGGTVLLPRDGIRIGGVFTHEVRDKFGNLKGEPVSDHNIMVNEGLNNILSVVYNAGTQITTWYIGIFEGNYTPVATDTAANIASNSTESTAYDESVRQTYVEAAPASQSITNSASKATFTMNATKTIYGAFLISDSTKSGTSGTLNAASKFSASRSVVATDSLLVTYTITAADA